MLLVAKLFLAAGIALLAGNINTAHDSRVLIMLGLAIACGYVYQGPPFRYVQDGVGHWSIIGDASASITTMCSYMSDLSLIIAKPLATAAHVPHSLDGRCCANRR